MMMEALKLFLKDNFNSLWQDKEAKASLRIALAILLFSLALLIFTWSKLPPQLPLFYSLPWGEEQLGQPILLLVPPIGCLLWGALNFFLAVFCFKQQPLASKILVWSTVILTFLSSLTLVKIIFLII